MSKCKVNNMNIISYSCSIMSIIIITKYAESNVAAKKALLEKEAAEAQQ